MIFLTKKSDEVGDRSVDIFGDHVDYLESGEEQTTLMSNISYQYSAHEFQHFRGHVSFNSDKHNNTPYSSIFYSYLGDREAFNSHHGSSLEE